MNRQDFDKWLKEVGVHFDTIGGYNWKLGADAAYNLLSKEISEKDEEIAKLKKEFDVMVGNDSRQEQEIERLKALIEELHYSSSVYDALADNNHPSKANDIALEKWQQFKKENNL